MNKFLEKDVKLKLGYFEDEKISQEDLKNITELGLNNFTFSNKEKGIDLNELRLFPNLEMLTLQHFTINDEVIKMLCEFQKLSSIQLASCYYETKDSYNIPSLEDLIIDNCRFKKISAIYAPKNLIINGIAKTVDLSTIKGEENIETLRLSNIKKITNFAKVMEMQKLKSLNLDGTKVDDKKILEILKAKIPVSQKSESLNIR